ncbi:MAG: Flp pilus assembly protein CpaB [Chloroflexi bacterium]|nr:Flp pilus assembly protein CpaB [Chloroflexota bacterium]
MRRPTGYALLLIGLVMALLVGLAVFRQARRAEAAAQIDTSESVVALSDIPARTVILPAQVGRLHVLARSAPADAFTSEDLAIGRMTRESILTGDVVVPRRLTGSSTGGATAAELIPSGRVAIGVPVGDTLSIAPLRAGDFVDLLVTIDPGGYREDGSRTGVTRATTQMTMQRLVVLSMGPLLTGPAEKVNGSAAARTPGQSVIFAVEPQEALILKALKDSPRVKLEIVLRAAGDADQIVTDAVTLESIASRYGFIVQAEPSGPAP